MNIREICLNEFNFVQRIKLHLSFQAFYDNEHLISVVMLLDLINSINLENEISGCKSFVRNKTVRLQ